MAKFVIIGAGIAGLAAARELVDAGEDAQVFEKQDKPGGLLQGFTIEDFYFDQAVHLSFTQDVEVRKVFDRTDFHTHKPESLCYDDGLWLRHPVQNNLFALPVETRVELIKSFVLRNESSPSNYKEWLYGQYGEKIADRYFVKYTEKYWRTNPEQMTLDWIKGRIAKPSLETVLAGAMAPRTHNDFYAKEMRYPKHGGFFSFVRPLLDGIDVVLNKRVQQISPADKKITFHDGSCTHYETLISSMPLPEIVKCIPSAPADVQAAASRLKATSVLLISIGFSRTDVAKHLWSYIYDADISPSRFYSPNVKSANNVPPGTSAIQFEVYFGPGEEMHMQQMADHVVDALTRKMRLAHANDILFVDSRAVQYANVIFDHALVENRRDIRNFLKEMNIESIGRFGEWDYLWSDQSLLSGKHAAMRLLQRGGLLARS